MKKISVHTLMGLAACAGVYLFVFIYLQVSSYTGFGVKTQFDMYSKIEDDEIGLTAENIERNDYSGGDISNISRDMNDSRMTSSEDWSENTYDGNPEEVVKDIEQQFKDETGGEERREEMLKEHQAKLEEQRKENEKQNIPQTTASDNQFSGEVMVKWELSGRTAYKNENWYVRNPGYTCGYNSKGTVTVRIKVNRNGSVVDAHVDGASSAQVSACMKSKALEYAKKSRFNFKPSGSTIQTGYISYIFISQ